MASTGLGVTIGSHTLRAVKLKRKGAGFVVQKVFSERVDDATRPAAGRALAARGLTGAPVTLGLTGRDVIIRYSQVPPVPEWRLKTLMKFEVEEVGSQSGGDVSADYRRLNLPDPEGTRAEETILVALARNRHVDALLKALASGGLKTCGGCPNSVALFNAFAVNATYTEEETAILVNVGSDDLDIAIQRGGELLFARNATPGGKAFTEALMQAFSTTESKAEQMKLSKGDVTPKGQAKYADSTSEKVANAMMGVAGQMSSLIQSTLMIARAQTRITDLRIDRVLLSGGGASLKGLDLYLKQAMGVPVERFNPFAICDLSGLSAEEKELVEAAPHEFAVAVGLAQTPLSPAAFRLEVLPAGLRRQREFWNKGIWAVAAAAAMGGVLWFLYRGRIESSDASDTTASSFKAKAEVVRTRDKKVREAAKRSQEEEVRYRLLATRLAPGRLVADAWSILSKQLESSQDVYLQALTMTLEEPSNEVEYVRPRKEQPGTGYEKVNRARGLLRQATVTAVLRVSGGTNQNGVAQAFITACQDNPLKLVVDAPKRFQAGKPGEDGTFELAFSSGLRLEPAGQGTAPVLHDPQLQLQNAPRGIQGFNAAGMQVLIPFSQISPVDLQKILKERWSQALKPEEIREIVEEATKVAAATGGR